MKIETFYGPDIAPFIELLGRYRIEIFREYPYVYDGNMDYERKYLSRYPLASQSFLLLGRDASGIACAVTGIPLECELDEFKQTLLECGMSLENMYYLGEIMIRRELRGQGLGWKLLGHALQTMRDFGRFKHAVLCTVQRQQDHPLRPAGYVYNDRLWLKSGFESMPGVTVLFSWKDLGEQRETIKEMAYWIAPLASDS